MKKTTKLEKIMSIMPTHYWKPALDKAKRLLEGKEVRFCLSSAGKRTHNAIYYNYYNNKLYEFQTERDGDTVTKDKFFKNGFTKSQKYHKIYDI
jgi:hypothetical protein